MTDAGARNRAAFPFASSCMDASARFNPTLKYAREGDREIGKPMEKGMDWFQTAPYVRGGK